MNNITSEEPYIFTNNANTTLEGLDVIDDGHYVADER